MNRGVVYTPQHWADWAVREFRIAGRWAEGAVILDPGCGTGALSEAVLRGALAMGFKPGSEDLMRLTGIDTDRDALEAFRTRISAKYGLLLPEDSILEGDYLLDGPPARADIILANPPWVTFGDLEPDRKRAYKPLFRDSGLAPDPRSLLLGGSRIDVAALFVATALERDLRSGGEGYFFLPSSLFRGEGAHEAFRNLRLPGGRDFSLTSFRELDGGAPFPGAGTRYGFAAYRIDRPQSWPVPWYRAGPEDSWERLEARPVDGMGSPLLPVPPGVEPRRPPRIPVPAGTRPRQGINSCGAAEVYIVNIEGEEENGGVPIVGRTGRRGRLPRDLLHPLMDGDCFTGRNDAAAKRWLFLPYHLDGRLMDGDELAARPDALEWLELHHGLLENRKGSLIGRFIRKGQWWAVLGIGSYAFAPWKLAWEAYGRNRFRPRLFEVSGGQYWQGNQALHAYLPFFDKDSALKALQAMDSPVLEEYLRLLGGANTKSWAQPGRISRLLEYA